VTVLYARATGGYRLAAKEAWERLSRWLAAHDARRRIRRGFGLFHDNPQATMPELLRYDACVELMTGLEAEEGAGIGRQTLAGGTYAMHTHVGGYEPVGGIFSQLHRDWIPKQGLSVDYDRPFMAIHLNDPLLTREVHRRTELCVPVLPLRDLLPADMPEHEYGTAALLVRLGNGRN